MSEAKKSQRTATIIVVVKGNRIKAYKRANGFWYAEYRDAVGKRRRESIRVRNKNDVEEAIRSLFGESKGTGSVEGFRPLPITQGIELFLQHRREVKQRRPKTLSKYKAALDAFLRYCEGQSLRTVQQITLAHLEGFQVYRSRAEQCALPTVAHDAVVLKCLFRFLCNDGRKLLTQNPAVGWEIEKPRVERRHCFTTEEVRMMRDGCRDWLKPIVTALAYTGMRIGELEHLRWQDVDLEAGMINVTAREDWKPKNGMSRSIPILPEVRGELLRLKLGRKGAHVFRTPRGKQVNQNHVREALAADMKKLCIPEGTPHSFRHFFVSLCANNGTPEHICMTWVGHRDSAMIRHYYHLHDDVSRQAMADLAERIGHNRPLAQSGTDGCSGSIGTEKETA